MGGIRGAKPKLSDSSQSRYERMRGAAASFSLVQVGLCTFHTPTDGEGAFIARPYNFWVVPAGRPLTLDHSSARFLRSHGLDFNAWIEEGVLTLSAAELDSAVQDLRTRHAQRSGRATPTGGADAAFVADAIAKAKEWAAARLAGETGGTDDVHDLPPCNAFLRRCLYESIEEAFPAHAYPALKTESVQIDPPDASAGGTATNRSRPAASGRAVKAIRLRWDPSVAAGDSMSETTDRLAQDLAALEARAGFLHIWRALCSAAVPVVLHNGLFDLMFLYNVLVGPLPEDVDEFKHAISQLLPEVWDTKLLAEASAGYSDSSLEGTFKAAAVASAALGAAAVHKQGALPGLGSLFTLAPGFTRYADKEGGAAHEAAYDALMTGVAFAHLRARHAPLRLRSCVALAASPHAFSLTGSLDPIAVSNGDAGGVPPVVLHLSIRLAAAMEAIPTLAARASIASDRANGPDAVLQAEVRTRLAAHAGVAKPELLILHWVGTAGQVERPRSSTGPPAWLSEAVLVLPRAALTSDLLQLEVPQTTSHAFGTTSGDGANDGCTRGGSVETWLRIDPITTSLARALGSWGGGDDAECCDEAGADWLRVEPYLRWRMRQRAEELRRRASSQATAVSAEATGNSGKCEPTTTTCVEIDAGDVEADANALLQAALGRAAPESGGAGVATADDVDEAALVSETIESCAQAQASAARAIERARGVIAATRAATEALCKTREELSQRAAALREREEAILRERSDLEREQQVLASDRDALDCERRLLSSQAAMMGGDTARAGSSSGGHIGNGDDTAPDGHAEGDGTEITNALGSRASRLKKGRSMTADIELIPDADGRLPKRRAASKAVPPEGDPTAPKASDGKAKRAQATMGATAGVGESEATDGKDYMNVPKRASRVTRAIAAKPASTTESGSTAQAAPSEKRARSEPEPEPARTSQEVRPKRSTARKMAAKEAEAEAASVRTGGKGLDGSAAPASSPPRRVLRSRKVLVQP